MSKTGEDGTSVVRQSDTLMILFMIFAISRIYGQP